MAAYATVKEDYSLSPARNEALSSGVTWSAVFGGAFAAGALSLILMALGTGVGLSSLSPWPNAGVSASKVGAGAIVWIIFVQIAASAMGGYLAGRLRTRWVALHTHEVYFRDTAHGFLVWAVSLVMSTLLFATFATTSIAAMNGGGSVSADAQMLMGNSYFVDMLFRTDHPATANDQAFRAEAALILANALRQPDMPSSDKSYLAALVSAGTGLNQAQALRRVSDTIAADQAAADAARKAAAHSLYWLFVALLLGAFCASYAATIGGRQRDHVPA